MSSNSNSTSGGGVDRIEKLQRIEQEIGSMLAHAGEAVDELCKPSPSVESVQGRTKEFLKSVEFIEQGLSEQISYLSKVSTMHSHEGSNYGGEKDYELLSLQTTLAKERLS